MQLHALFPSGGGGRGIYKPFVLLGKFLRHVQSMDEVTTLNVRILSRCHYCIEGIITQLTLASSPSLYRGMYLKVSSRPECHYRIPCARINIDIDFAGNRVVLNRDEQKFRQIWWYGMVLSYKRVSHRNAAPNQV